MSPALRGEELGRQWFGEVPTLCGVAAKSAQPGRLARCLDLLSGDGKAKCVRQVDHRSGDLFVREPILDVATKVLDELAGEFDHVDRQVA